MSNRYKGGIISATPPTTTGGESGTASGAWTLEQQMQLTAAGLWPLQPTPKYIEDVFSTWLYTGNGATQTVTNGIDLAGEGGAVWIKGRNQPEPHVLVDTARGASNALRPNSTAASINDAGRVSAFTGSGFTTGGDGETNGSGTTYASWTFREQPKFFDIVTYTGNGSNPRTISHNLGSTPGCIIFKSVNEPGYGWVTWHRSLNANGALQLQTTDAEIIDANLWGGSPTDTTFSVSSYSGQNASGVQYVAYVFAHNAGGFGLSGTDNVISCGSFTTPASDNAVITLGYEPQWLLVKCSSNAQDWFLVDSMRGLSQTEQRTLLANTSAAEEATDTPYFRLTATGFTASPASIGGSRTFIYIAIRRGPMRTPTTGTSVFTPLAAAGSTGTKLATDFPVDLQIWSLRGDGGSSKRAVDRLRGISSNTTTSGAALFTDLTSAEDTASASTRYFDNTGFTIPGNFLGSGLNAVYWNFRRAPGFFDEVCYTGTGLNSNFSHNLQVVPEMLITKRRSNTGPWVVYTPTTGIENYLQLYTNDAVQTNTSYYNFTPPTASVFTLGSSTSVNASGNGFVAYLFATLAGVSKVGSYTGTGTTQVINCGFTAGSRFVMIKRTDSTGDWYVWDSARGIVAGNDPYLLLNSSAAEVTNTDFVDTAATGFEISSTAPAAINANGGTFIFLAIS